MSNSTQFKERKMSDRKSYMDKENLLGESFFGAIKKMFKGKKLSKSKDPQIKANINKMNDNFESIEKSLQDIENRIEKQYGGKARKVKLPRFTSSDFLK
jgi:hypothetical protein